MAKLDVTFEADREFEQLPNGIYPVQIVDASTGISGAGYKKLDLVFKVIEGDYEGRNLWKSVSLEKATWVLKMFLVSAGLLDPSHSGNFSFDTEDLIGKLLRVEVKVNPEFTYNEVGRPFPYTQQGGSSGNAYGSQSTQDVKKRKRY